MIIRCCEDCAEKFGRIYIVSREETESPSPSVRTGAAPFRQGGHERDEPGKRDGERSFDSGFACAQDDRDVGEAKCPFCFRSGRIHRYEMTKPAVRYRRQSGGGERMRSGGRR